MATTMRTTAWSTTAYFAVILSLLSFLISPSTAEAVLINGTGIDGVERQLDVRRYPALYTGDFADCLSGGSLLNVTKFDAAYYADNLTVVFHLDGSTNIRKESVALHLSIEAYGENRLSLKYDPCGTSISSLCPLSLSQPIHAYAATTIVPADVSNLPSVSLGLPDFEGFARLRIFANSTKTEIGCFQAVMRNGQTFSQPASVGTITGLFTLLAALASFLTGIYGLSIPHMRTHYAHSFSVLVIIETFQSFFFSGALAVNWPSVLPAWWSNFAWSAGMFGNTAMLRSISKLTGNEGNITQVGGAGSIPINNQGGLAQQIYGRSLAAVKAATNNLPGLYSATLQNRAAAYDPNNPYDYSWSGGPQAIGTPMPGTWPGFAGTLSNMGIPPAEVFILYLIWFLVILGAVALFVITTKLLLDLLIRLKLLKTDGFDYFRSHLSGYILSALLRTVYIGFFGMMTVTMFQFSFRGPSGPTALASIVFLIFLVGLGSIAAYACYFRLRDGKFETGRDTLRLERGTIFKKIPFPTTVRQSAIGETETARPQQILGTVPFFRVKYTENNANRPAPHHDEGFIKRFGWLSGRYRGTRWWFFAYYLAYQFVRACFLGGGSRTPLAQVYGFFLWEVLAAIAIVKLKPFEGSRNSTVAVWLLSVSKVVTAGLSIAFLPDFSLNRIATTILAIIIIVVQAFLAVIIAILVVLGILSTWMSLSRNREEFPEGFNQVRIRYFDHMNERSGHVDPTPKDVKTDDDSADHYFNVKDVRRAPKIEDDDDDEEDDLADMEAPPQLGTSGTNSARRSRANSASSRYSVSSIPRAARVHRQSWSSKEFSQMQAEMLSRPESQRITHSRNSSLQYPVNIMSIVEGEQSERPETPSRRPMTPTKESREEEEQNLPAKTADLHEEDGTQTKNEPKGSDNTIKEKTDAVMFEDNEKVQSTETKHEKDNAVDIIVPDTKA